MTKKYLLEQLKSEVTPQEYDLILEGKMPHISNDNAKTMLAMMRDNSVSLEIVDESLIAKLREVTYEYLARYLPEHPEARKWIYLSCAYKTYLLGVPMHAKEWVHYTTEVIDGQVIYRCPAKSREADTNCSFCVCEFPIEE